MRQASRQRDARRPLPRPVRPPDRQTASPRSAGPGSSSSTPSPSTSGPTAPRTSSPALESRANGAARSSPRPGATTPALRHDALADRPRPRRDDRSWIDFLDELRPRRSRSRVGGRRRLEGDRRNAVARDGPTRTSTRASSTSGQALREAARNDGINPDHAAHTADLFAAGLLVQGTTGTPLGEFHSPGAGGALYTLAGWPTTTRSCAQQVGLRRPTPASRAATPRPSASFDWIDGRFGRRRRSRLRNAQRLATRARARARPPAGQADLTTFARDREGRDARPCPPTSTSPGRARHDPPTDRLDRRAHRRCPRPRGERQGDLHGGAKARSVIRTRRRARTRPRARRRLAAARGDRRARPHDRPRSRWRG